MATYQDVFHRIEKKYRLTKSQYNMLKLVTSPHLIEDAYGVHTITNIYYDTDDYTLIRNSIDHPFYKEKLRLRTYGNHGKPETGFIEIKKKCDGVVYKRRVKVNVLNAQDYLSATDSTSPQILQEIRWFMARYNPKPKVMIAYERESFNGINDSGLRLTFDTDLRFRTHHLDVTYGSDGFPIIDPAQVILEIKAQFNYPLWLTRALSELQIQPTPFSKYGFCYQNALISTAALPLKGVV